ncbi:DUF317 domain-containing protein [Streptomyces sp. NBC_00237]|uniref:DUF317 domain-containing protein n=1 Tax=Streptomyces sp. NBC_00237 TaxID=2975687 RepID=UPI00224CBE9D|nr:DUF317 domain-containing protein [Streptomyces sp. NBC_00237]MCX5206903.1 DUF317 domain-containing protein [Streptomyces sp. NBC_00237]
MTHPREFTVPDHTPYLIAPVYLAGPDPHAVTTVADVLTCAGWFPHPLHPHLLQNPGATCAARHFTPHPGNHPDCLIPAAPRQDRAGVWEFAAFRTPGGPPLWEARFSPATPPELTAAFAAALADTTPTPHGTPRHLTPGGPQAEATAPLAAAGWLCDIGTEHTWYPADHQAAVITPTPAPGGPDGNWVFAACRATDATTLWHAQATPTTPAHLITALCRALTDPAPVPRPTLPAPDHGARTVPRPR